MLRVAGSDSLVDVLSNASNIRFRFENAVSSGVREHAIIDSVTAISEFPKSGTIIQLGLNASEMDNFRGI